MHFVFAENRFFWRNMIHLTKAQFVNMHPHSKKRFARTEAYSFLPLDIERCKLQNQKAEPHNRLKSRFWCRISVHRRQKNIAHVVCVCRHESQNSINEKINWFSIFFFAKLVKKFISYDQNIR
jgi:hypothetical protein